ncbi:MAG: flagellar hook-associated protein FlgL [Candidatus Thiodiazotropha sp. (ex Dulcina madagascariensis)]|nr:flagellar hook-associated protein FlgL [Candidatus Thiodiazotropha sp. (ex Dulcina madagascariensis)]MCU7927888.1 flagellar hook-associated protein FlgL [Candidatus Thiodiazotropha sp. (ex Dulcina madagascariensis)]
MERISTAMLFDRGINGMLERQSGLSRTQMQIASGKRILSPKDDPSGAAYALDLRTAISQVGQYQANADRARTRLDLQEASLKGVDDLIPRVLELTVQGLNDTNTAADRRAIAQELRQINDALMGLANTKDSNGEYIFAGYDGDSIPFSNPTDGIFAYGGDMGTRTLQISATRQVQDRENGFDVFMDIDTSTATKRNLFETVHGVIAGLEADAPNDVLLDDLHLVQAQISDARTRGGARLNTIDQQQSINADFILNMQTALSETEDLDLAEAVSRFEQELLALQAAQQTFNMVQGLSLFNFL